MFIEFMQGNIVLQILPWNVMRWKWTIRETLIRETHCDIRNIRTES